MREGQIVMPIEPASFGVPPIRPIRAVDPLYAAQRGLENTGTYSDEAASGLRIEGRNSLQRLLPDAESDRRDFAMILVYDVTRWGRFQDTELSPTSRPLNKPR